MVKILLAWKGVDFNCTRASPSRHLCSEKSQVTVKKRPNPISHWLVSYLGRLKQKTAIAGNHTVSSSHNYVASSMTVYTITSVDDDFRSDLLDKFAADGLVKMALACSPRVMRRMLRLLFDAGVDPNVHVLPAQSALEFACNREDEDLVRLLVSEGAKNTQREGVISGLEVACYDGTLGIAKLLIANGSDVNHKGEPGLVTGIRPSNNLNRNAHTFTCGSG